MVDQVPEPKLAFVNAVVRNGCSGAHWRKEDAAAKPLRDHQIFAKKGKNKY